jgi:uncharacterized protein
LIESPRVVLDTNVVLSAMLWGGRPSEFFLAAGNGDIALFCSNEMLVELAKSLSKQRFTKQILKTGLTKEQHLLRYGMLVSIIAPAGLSKAYSRDPDDDRVIACAIAAQAHMLVTGDDDLLVLESVEGVSILTVADSLALIAAQADHPN